MQFAGDKRSYSGLSCLLDTACWAQRRNRTHLCRRNYPRVSLTQQLLFALASVCVSVCACLSVQKKLKTILLRNWDISAPLYKTWLPGQTFCDYWHVQDADDEVFHFFARYYTTKHNPHVLAERREMVYSLRSRNHSKSLSDKTILTWIIVIS